MNTENHTSRDMYGIKVVTNVDEFIKLESSWNRLSACQKTYTPYLCFDFFDIWLKHFLGQDNLFILLVFKSEEIVAIAPFVIKNGRYKGVNVSKIELIGNVYSPMRYFLFAEMDKGEKESILVSIFNFLANNYKKWDLMDLNPIIEENDYFDVVKAALYKSKLSNSDYFCFGNWYQDGIEPSSNIYSKSLTRNFRASINKNRKKAEARGSLEFKMITKSSELDPFMKVYFEVYECSWKQREKAGPAYYLNLTQNLADKGWLRLGMLYLNNVPIATGFAVVHNGTAYFEKTAYNEEYEDVGAGKLWHVEMIKHVIDKDKIKVIDLLRGDYEYKKNWVSKRRERKGILVFNKTFKGYYLNLLIIKVLPLFQRNECLNKFKLFISRKILRINPT